MKSLGLYGRAPSSVVAALFLDLIGNLLAVPIGTLGRLQIDPAHFYSAVWTCSTAYILSKDATLMGP